MWGADGWGAWAGHVTLPCLKWVTSEDLLEHRGPCWIPCGRLGGGGLGRRGACVCAAESPCPPKLSQHCWLALLHYRMQSFLKKNAASLDPRLLVWEVP